MAGRRVGDHPWRLDAVAMMKPAGLPPLYKIAHWLIMGFLLTISLGALLLSAKVMQAVWAKNETQATAISEEMPLSEYEVQKSLEYLEENNANDQKSPRPD